MSKSISIQDLNKKKVNFEPSTEIDKQYNSLFGRKPSNVTTTQAPNVSFKKDDKKPAIRSDTQKNTNDRKPQARSESKGRSRSKARSGSKARKSTNEPEFVQKKSHVKEETQLSKADKPKETLPKKNYSSPKLLKLEYLLEQIAKTPQLKSKLNLRLEIKPINTFATEYYKLYLVDCFATNDDIKKIMDYLTTQKSVGISTLFSKSSVVTFVQITTLDAGFIFYVNEDRADCEKYASEQKIHFDKNTQLIKKNLHFRLQLKKLVTDHKVTKVCSAADRVYRSLNKLLGTDSLASSANSTLDFKEFYDTEEEIFLECSEKSKLVTLVKRIFGCKFNFDVLNSFQDPKNSYLYTNEAFETIMFALLPLVFYKFFNSKTSFMKTEDNGRIKFQTWKIPQLIFERENVNFSLLKLDHNIASQFRFSIKKDQTLFILDFMCKDLASSIKNSGYEYYQVKYEDSYEGKQR